MPYFNWIGIDLLGQMHKGRLFARSLEELDLLLLKQEIALLRSKPIKPAWSFKQVPLVIKIEFFRQLSQLLATGVLLPDALIIVESQINNAKFQTIIAAIAQEVYQGQSLSYALAQHPKVFSPLMICMIEVGQTSGSLVNCLQLLSSYLTATSEFGHKIKSASLVPASTFGFFCILTIIIFTIIVPQFVTLFNSAQVELPWVTRVMLQTSGFLTSYLALGVLVACIFALGALKYLAQKDQGKLIIDTIILKLPIVGTAIKESSLAYFLYALSMLLTGGMQLVPAIKIAKNTVSNAVLKNRIEYIEQEIEGGYSLSMAMLHDPAQIFDPEIVSMIRVGEECGKLTSLLDQGAVWYQEKVKRVINMITLLINPLMMLILGLLVTFLIFAVYLPIFNLANVVH